MDRIRSPSRLLLALAATAALPAPPALAQSAGATPSGAPAAAQERAAYDVYVTSERDLVDSVTTVHEISREDMRQENARTVDEALVHQPSMIVRTGGEGEPRIDVRGLRSRQVLLLLDGVPFNSSEEGEFDPSLIPTEILDGIDTAYSASSVLYGDGPLAGVLQLRTQMGQDGVQTGGSGEARERGQYLGVLSGSGAAQGFDGFVSSQYLSSKGYDVPEGYPATSVENGGLRENAERDQRNLFARLGWAPDERSRVGILGDYRHAEFEVPPNTRSDPGDPFATTPRFERVADLDGYSVQLSGQTRPAEQVELRSWGFANHQREDRRRYDDADLESMNGRNTFRRIGTTLVAGGALHGRVDFDELGALRLAANGRAERFDAEGHIRDVPAGGGSFLVRPIDATDGIGAWSLGAEYELKPFASTGLVLGYGHAWLDGDGGVGDDDSLFLAGAYQDFPTRTRLRAAVARKLRFPSIAQLYDVDGGNSDLDAERCWCFELGIEQWLARSTHLSLTAFQLELSDFIERDNATRVFENRQRLRNRGIEAAVASRPWDWLLLRASYSFLDARDRSDDSPFDELDNRPRHKVDAEVRAQTPWHTTLRLALGWVAGTLIYTRNAPYAQRELPSFALLDLSISQRVWSDQIRVYAGVDNVLDAEAEINYGFPEPGRTFLGGVELRL